MYLPTYLVPNVDEDEKEHENVSGSGIIRIIQMPATL